MSDSVQLFSARSDDYARFRPVYPDALFAWLAKQCPERHLALDIAAGNGQATLSLTRHFQRLLACDASSQQLAAGRHWQDIERFVAEAEHLPLKDGQLDLIVVAQALHWFATPAFFDQARQALKPGGLFCAWCYSLMRIDPALDELVEHLHGETLNGYWPTGRASVDAGYQDILPPFPRIETPGFALTARWPFQQFVGYLRTWSAVESWQRKNRRDPVSDLEPLLLQAWGDPDQERIIRWPLHLLAGYPGH